MTFTRTFAIVLLTASALSLPLAADVPLSRQDGDEFYKRVLQINQNAELPAKTARETELTERQVNSYLRYHAGDQIPEGVVDPYITILGNGHLAGRATVDLDAVRAKRSSGGWFDPLSYLTGRLPITANAILHTRAGVGRLELQSADVSGVPIPKVLLQEIVSYYSKSPSYPNGVNLDDQFELPAEINEIRIGKGNAIIVQ